MASELRITTLANNAGTESVDTTYVVNGSNKVWLYLNGTGTIAIGDSLNVASVTDVGTGQYRPYLTSAFSSINYSVCKGDNERGVGESNPNTSSAFDLISRNSSFSAVDVNKISVNGNGDLA